MTQRSSMKNRNSTLDITKGIGIILVVFGHNWAVLHEGGELFRVIFSFHMPLFLFLSGIFLRESDSLKIFLRLRINSLIKPYFVTLLLLGVAKFSIEAIKTKALPSKYYEYIEGILYATGRTIDWGPLWFLPHLFLASFATLLVIKFIQSSRVQLIILVLALACGVMILNPTDLPWSLDLVPISSSFILAGYIARCLVKEMTFDLIYFLVAITIFVSLHFFFDVTLDLNLRLYGELFISTLQAFSGIYLCLSLSVLLANCKVLNEVLSYIGSGTLFILIFHTFFQGKTFNVISKFIDGSQIPVICSLIAGVILPLIFWEVAKRSKYLTMAFLPEITSNCTTTNSSNTGTNSHGSLNSKK